MKQLRSRLGAVALALLVVIATFAFALPVSAQDSDVTEIDSCTVIDEAGTYVLTDDITDSDEDVCIEIRADNVTLDGNGYTIDGVDAADSIGVYVVGDDENQEGGSSPNDVTIRDLTVTDWGTGIGFRFASGDVTAVTAMSNEDGLNLLESSADVSDSDFSGNDRDGISVDQSAAEISDVTANDNGGAGISAFDAQIELRDSTLTGNRVGIEDTESTITVTDSTVADNDVQNEYSTDADDGSGADDGNSDDGADGGDDSNVGDSDDEDGDAGDDDKAGGDKSDDKKDDEKGSGDGSSDGDASDDDDIVDVGSKDIEIDLGDVTIADFELDGPGLSDTHIDERTYEVGGFDIAIDGLDLTIGDTHYRVGHVSITVEPFDVILENVTLGDGDSR